MVWAKTSCFRWTTFDSYLIVASTPIIGSFCREVVTRRDIKIDSCFADNAAFSGMHLVVGRCLGVRSVLKNGTMTCVLYILVCLSKPASMGPNILVLGKDLRFQVPSSMDVPLACKVFTSCENSSGKSCVT